MTRAQKKLARHALGVDRPRTKKSYRNRYAATPGSPSFYDWLAMVAMGEAEQGAAFNSAGGTMFHLTEAGATLALNKGETLDPEDFPQ